MILPKIMKAAVVHEFGQKLQVENVDVPEPGPGQVLVQVAACGVCHTDLHAAEGDWPVKPTLPFVPGHEGVGTVIQLGEGVDQVAIGERVGVPWLFEACGRCEQCVDGWETLCEKQKNTGYSVNGSFAEYVVAPADYVAVLPHHITFADAAPILCAGVTTYKGLKETDTKPGDWIAIVGIGGLGHLAVQYAKVMGLKVIALDINDEKLSLAAQLGADMTANISNQDALQRIVECTGGGVHGALVTAVSTDVIPKTIGLMRRKGTCVLVGLPVGGFPTPLFEVVLKRLTIRGSIVGNRNDLSECLAIAAEGNVKSHKALRPLEDINEVFDEMKRGEIEGRVVLKIRE